MKNSTKKAVILNNLTSPYIYQAIVILNENGMRNENKALEDAERIVSEYIANTKTDEGEDIILYSRPKKRSEKHMSLKLIFGICLSITTLIFGFFLFGK